TEKMAVEEQMVPELGVYLEGYCALQLSPILYILQFRGQDESMAKKKMAVIDTSNPGIPN
ncbi:hypothetical protein P7K49_024873, partial [Saguinus oedipus]